MTLPIVLHPRNEYHFFSFFFTIPLKHPTGGTFRAPPWFAEAPCRGRPLGASWLLCPLSFFLRISQGGALRAPPWGWRPPATAGSAGVLGPPLFLSVFNSTIIGNCKNVSEALGNLKCEYSSIRISALRLSARSAQLHGIGVLPIFFYIKVTSKCMF